MEGHKDGTLSIMDGGIPEEEVQGKRLVAK